MNENKNTYKEAFLNEAKMHVATMNASLLKLERTPNDSQIFHDLFRATHTLKSISAAMEYQQCSTLCHKLEDLLDAIKNNNLDLDLCIDAFFDSFDFIAKDLKNIEKKDKENDAASWIEKLQSLSKGQTNFVNNSINSENNMQTAPMEKVQSVGVKVERLDSLLNLIEDLLVNKMKLETLRDTIENLEFNNCVEALGRIVSELQYNVMQLRLVAIGFIFNQFPRMVRDIAKAQNKKIKLILEGDDIELDRSVVDEISESLVHLVRNAIDHGLESPTERIKANKPEEGMIKLVAGRDKENIMIKVMDDGRGLDVKELKEKAINLGILDANATTEEVYNVIFSEISTAKEISNLSGRGLGLNIVKQKIDSIGGSIRVESKANEGTTFIIHIPLSLAVIKTLFVKVAERIYAIPVTNIQRLVVVDKQDLKSVFDNSEIILDNEDIPVMNLREVFGDEKNVANKLAIVIVQHNNIRFGLGIDELLTTEEIVIKPLNSIVKDNKYFSGSAIIGSGEMILILDIQHLFLQRHIAEYGHKQKTEGQIGEDHA